MKKILVKVALGLIWFLSAFISVAFWLSALTVASAWGFSAGSLRWWMMLPALVAPVVAIVTGVIALRYDRGWP